jgi:hypothetical protein
MSSSSSDSESIHSSQCDSEYNYIPGYIIEDELNDTHNEFGTLEAADKTSSGDYDACLYANEPLAGEEWFSQYLEKSAEQKRQTEMLQKRLDGLEDVVKSW